MSSGRPGFAILVLCPVDLEKATGRGFAFVATCSMKLTTKPEQPPCDGLGMARQCDILFYGGVLLVQRELRGYATS